MESIVNATGKRPIGWNAYWMRNTPRTLDILAKPRFLTTLTSRAATSLHRDAKGGDFVTVPYTFISTTCFLPVRRLNATAYERHCATSLTNFTRRERTVDE